MTDLEKLKAVFDDIGVGYRHVNSFSEYLILFGDDYQIDINFKDGKFTYID